MYTNRAQKYDSLPELSWLTGIWVGSEADQYAEEHWSQSVSNQLIGMFRLMQSDETVFYEFMTIGLEDHRTTLSIKHFNSDLVGWEDKDQAVKYDLVREEPTALVFFKRHAQEENWMVYRRTGNQLEVFFADSMGEVEGSRFEFERYSTAFD
jgi:hypothetical protein